MKKQRGFVKITAVADFNEPYPFLHEPYKAYGQWWVPIEYEHNGLYVTTAIAVDLFSWQLRNTWWGKILYKVGVR